MNRITTKAFTEWLKTNHMQLYQQWLDTKAEITRLGRISIALTPTTRVTVWKESLYEDSPIDLPKEVSECPHMLQVVYTVNESYDDYDRYLEFFYEVPNLSIKEQQKAIAKRDKDLAKAKELEKELKNKLQELIAPLRIESRVV